MAYNTTLNFEISKFNITKHITFLPTEKKAPIITLLGKRGSGKSYLLRDIMSHFTDLKFGTVISGTELSSPFFCDFMPRVFINYEYDPIIIAKLLQRQLSMVKEQLKGNAQNIDNRAFLILDDCLFDQRWTRDKIMRLIFLNGRHWNLMTIITMQTPLGITPLMRDNIDYAFILNFPQQNAREKIYVNYASVFPTKESFFRVLDATTEDNECLVVKNCGNSRQLKDNVFWYKASSKIPEFKIGDKLYWSISEKLNNEFPSLENMFYDNKNSKNDKNKQIVINKK